MASIQPRPDLPKFGSPTAHLRQTTSHVRALLVEGALGLLKVREPRLELLLDALVLRERPVHDLSICVLFDPGGWSGFSCEMLH